MRRAGIFHFFAFVFMLLFLAACGFFEIFNTGGTDPGTNSRCNNVLKKHAKSLELSLHLTCLYEKTCDADVFFGIVYDNGFEDDRCYGDYSYKLVAGKAKETVSLNTTVPVTVDDDHVRFSLFDEDDVEKSYDIDLFEIIHSYTVKDDSVEIRMPKENFKMSIVCPFCSGRNYTELCEGTYACHYRGNSDLNPVNVGVDSTWGKSFTFHQYLWGQSSMKADSIYIHGNIYFR